MKFKVGDKVVLSIPPLYSGEYQVGTIVKGEHKMHGPMYLVKWNNWDCGDYSEMYLEKYMETNDILKGLL